MIVKYILSDKCRDTLLKMYPNQNNNLVCREVVLFDNPTAVGNVYEKHFHNLKTIRIVGVWKDDSGIVFQVEVNGRTANTAIHGQQNYYLIHQTRSIGYHKKLMSKTTSYCRLKKTIPLDGTLIVIR